MRTQTLKRLVSLLLCLCLVTGLLPVTVLAADLPAITPDTLEAATVGEQYTATLTATRSDPNSDLFWTATNLPAWLVLLDNGDGTATLDGTPTEAGEVTFTVILTESIPPADPEEPNQGTEPVEGTDPAGETAPAEPAVLTASKEYTLTVEEAAPANEPNRGTEPEDEPGADLLLTTDGTDGGTTRASFLSVSATIYTGQESGTGAFIGQTNTFAVDQAGLILHLDDFQEDVPSGWSVEYIAFYPADGHDPYGPRFWTKISSTNGTLNDKLYVNGSYNGVVQLLNFTPNGSSNTSELPTGTYRVQVSVSDGNYGTNYQEKVYLSNETFTITGETVLRPTILTGSLPNGAVNQPYQATLEATPGTPGNNLAWSLDQGSSLPNWLTLTDNKDGTATLSGTPTKADTVSFYLTVTETTSSGVLSGTANKLFLISFERTPFQFTLDGTIDADVYGKLCYLKGTAEDGTRLTLWSGMLVMDTTSLPINERYLDTTVRNVELVYSYRGGSAVLAKNAGPVSLTGGGSAVLTGTGDALVGLPYMSNPYVSVGGSLWFQNSAGRKYPSGELAPNETYTLGADLYYIDLLSGDTLYALNTPMFSGTGVTGSNGVYTYAPAQNSDNSPIALQLEESALTTYTVQLVSEGSEALPDLSGAQIRLSQNVGSRTYIVTGTVEYKGGINSATVELYSGMDATPILTQAGQYFPKESSVNPQAGANTIQLTVIPETVQKMTLALSAMPAGTDQDETLAEYTQLLETSNAVSLDNISLGKYSMPAEMPTAQNIYSTYDRDELNKWYEEGSNSLTLSWKENGPVNAGTQTISWSKGSLLEHAELEISVKGGVLADVTNQSDTVYFVPWWYNESKGWLQRSTVRVGVGETESLALWCPGSTDTGETWNLLLLTSNMAGPSRGVTWEVAKNTYPGMPYKEGISIQNDEAQTAQITVTREAVDSVLYLTKPYSTFVGPDQFESTGDLLVYTGHIQLKEGYDNRMTVLRLDAAGTDAGGRVATQISSVVVDGVEYPYTKIELASGTDPDQLVSKQFQTYYQITFTEPVELPCDFTVYAKPMLMASDAVLTASVNLENMPNSSYLVGKAVVKAPDLSVSIPSITGSDTVTAYVSAPANTAVQVYEGDELVATAWNGSAEIPLCGTSKSMTTSHRLTFRYTDASGAARSVTRTVLHAPDLPTVTKQNLQVNYGYGYWSSVSRNTIYSFTSASPAPFRMTCTIENAENIAGGVSFAVRFLDGTVRYIEAKQSGNTFTTEAFTSGSPVIGAQVLYELDWDKIQAAMNRNLTVPGGTLGSGKTFDSTVVLPWSDYKNELTQYSEAFAALEQLEATNPDAVANYQAALDENLAAMKTDIGLEFERATSREPSDVGTADTAEALFATLDSTQVPKGKALYSAFTRQVTQRFFQAELGNGSGFSRLILADGNSIKYEMYIKLYDLPDKGVTGTLVLAADYITADNPIYMETGSAVIVGSGAVASAANLRGGGPAVILAGSSGALAKDGETPTQSNSGGFYFTELPEGESNADRTTQMLDAYSNGVNLGADTLNTAIYCVDGTRDAVGDLGMAGSGYTTTLSVVGVGKSTYDTAVNYSTLGDLYSMSANLLNSPCAKKLAEHNPGFIRNMENQLTEYKAMLDDAGAWNFGVGAFNIVNGAVGAAGGYAVPWAALITGVAGMCGDNLVKQKISNCEATGTVLYDTVQLFIKKYANQYDDPECKGGGGGDIPRDKDQEKNPEDPYRACIDPSGVVYEAVLSNPVEGATVTLYTDGTGYTPIYNTVNHDGIQIPVMENADGSPAIPTNSYSGSGTLTTPVDSTIPADTILTTGADGRYQWMVTEGLWFVTAYKDGYQAGDSGNDVAAVVTAGGRKWLPVSPEQLNVNIPLVSYEAPTVTAEYGSDGVYLLFSKYMDDTTLKAAGAFQINGTAVDPGNVVLLNSEEAPDNIRYTGNIPSYTSQVKLNAANLTGNVTVTIGSGVKSYAGVPCTVSTVGGTVSDGPLVTAPTINGGGQVAYGSTVTIDVPEGAAVYYTTDGTIPNPANGTRYYAGQEIPVTRNMTLRAVAVKFGMTSAPVSVTFTVPDNAATATIGDPNNQAGDTPGGDTPGGDTPGGDTPGGGGGGDSDDDSYFISIPASSSVSGGSISVRPQSANKGDRVTITVTPDEGYELAKLIVTDRQGNEVTLTDLGNGKYTFIMPGTNVKIQVAFQKIKEEVVEVTNPFTDVSEGAWYYDAVLWAVDKGITNGTSATTFSPDMTVSRAQMVTFLWRAYGAPRATGSNPFADVSADAWYYDAVLWAVANGVTVGTSATTFSPDAPVTRSQAVTFQWRAAGSPVVTGDSFDDVAADAYYAGAVTWAVANGITNGTGGNKFSPEVTVTRAQAVTFLWRELA